MITDAKNNVIQVNDAFTHITGFSAEEVIGKKPHVIGTGLQDEVFIATVWEKVQHSGKWEGDVWNRRKNGEAYPEKDCPIFQAFRDGKFCQIAEEVFWRKDGTS